MNAHVQTPEAESETALAVIPQATAVAVLTDAKRFDDFYARVKAETDTLVPDVSTSKGRDAIRSMAMKVVKTKTAIDAAGKQLNEEARKQIDVVDAARRKIREKLDALRDEVRQPLTAWEEAEEARVERVKAALERLQAAAVVVLADTSETVAERLSQVQAITIAADEFQEYAQAAEAHRATAIETLAAAHSRLVKEEADRAELERLRAEASAREEAERIAREAAEQEARAVEAARLEAERIETAARAAEQAARDAAERAAENARLEQERAHAEALANERRRAEAAEATAQAERDRAAAAEAERLRQEQAAAEAERRRAADRAHRGRIMGEAKAALMGFGVGEELAKRIVLAITAGEVPHTSIKF